MNTQTHKPNTHVHNQNIHPNNIHTHAHKKRANFSPKGFILSLFVAAVIFLILIIWLTSY